jgi:hypothetical protein
MDDTFWLECCVPVSENLGCGDRQEMSECLSRATLDDDDDDDNDDVTFCNVCSQM